MGGISAYPKARVGAFLAVLVSCCALWVALDAHGAGAATAARGPFQCSFRSVKVTHQESRLDSKGRMRCTGNAVRRQVLRVCLLQDTESGKVEIKCVTHAKNGVGLVTGTASRICGTGPATGFITRIHIRLTLKGSPVQKATTDSSPTELKRNCGL
jgi:hypothetical protein